MPEVTKAIEATFDAARPTGDGENGLFRFLSGGAEIVLALPEADLLPLVASAAAVSDQCHNLRNSGSLGAPAFECSWWEVGRASDDRLLWTFRTPDGTTLRFVVGKAAGQPMIEALQSAMGVATPPPSDTRRH